jgi:hypothetical protein
MRFLLAYAATAIALSPLPAALAEADGHDPDFDMAAIMGHVEFLSDDLLEGRAAGTRGYEIAARYVATSLRRYGLQPGGNDGSFYQRFDLVEGRLAPESAEMSIDSANGSKRLETVDDFLVGGSYVDETTDVTAPLAFVGHGITAPELDHDDYAGLDVEGRILVMFSGAPSTFSHDQRAYYSTRDAKFPNAVERGAVGLLVVQTPEWYRKYEWDNLVRAYAFSGMRWSGKDGRIKGVYPQLRFGASLSREGLQKILQGSGVQPQGLYDQVDNGIAGGRLLEGTLTFRRRSEQSGSQGINVAAILPGADPDLRGEFVAITAHLDHIGIGPERDGDGIYNGAYDNAMGVAIMLEVARAMSEPGARPARSVLFLALDAEEKGLLGSDYFAEYPLVPMERIVANVNLDMPLFIYPLADVVAFGAEHSSLEAHVERAAAAAGLKLSPDPMPEEVLFIRSDQYPFVKQGVPAVFFVTGFTSSDPSINGGDIWRDFLRTHYHQPSDQIDLPFHDGSVVAFTLANYFLIQSIADDPVRPTWNRGDFFGDLFGGTR